MKLRQIAIALALLTGSTLAASAQTLYKPHLHVGVHGGGVLSSQSFNPSVEQSMLPGMTMGLSVRWAEERHVGLLAELSFTQRGWREKFEDKQFSYSHALDYIELPLLTHINFGSQHAKFFFNLGPQFCFLTGDRVSANFDYMNWKNVPDFPTRNRTNEQLSTEVSRKFDYGITGGAGMEIVIARRHSLMLEGRYYFGLGNIFPGSKRDYFNASRGNAIMVSLGYMFRLK